MNEPRFIELLASYGAELSRWPLEERAAAEEFLEFGPHRLKDLWESERVFDRLLALDKDGQPSIALETRVLSSATSLGRSAGRDGIRLRMPNCAAGGAIAASLALGFAVGYAGEPASRAASPSSVDAPQMLALSEGGSAAVLLSPETAAN
jgi:hypothetical protein